MRRRCQRHAHPNSGVKISVSKPAIAKIAEAAMPMGRSTDMIADASRCRSTVPSWHWSRVNSIRRWLSTSKRYLVSSPAVNSGVGTLPTLSSLGTSRASRGECRRRADARSTQLRLAPAKQRQRTGAASLDIAFVNNVRHLESVCSGLDGVAARCPLARYHARQCPDTVTKFPAQFTKNRGAGAFACQPLARSRVGRRGTLWVRLPHPTAPTGYGAGGF